MSRKQPVLGSNAIHVPQSHSVMISASTCLDLSVFKDLMREYRKLDDSITMRLNRSNAQFRDLDRTSGSRSLSADDEACAYVWKELIRNWKDRTEIVDYCKGVVDNVLKEQDEKSRGQTPALGTERTARSRRFSDEVKQNQIHNESTVESIVRQRSFDAFKSRCKYFTPPSTDPESQKWWDTVTSPR